MEGRLRKWRSKRDFLKLLQSRETNAETSKFFKQHSQFTDSLIKRLGLEFELLGHQGCVNCLEWTPNGEHLASGSDDTNIILWDPFRHKHLQLIPTQHIGNIFSVKFLGGSSTEIATASGDGRVLVQSIPTAVAKGHPLLECSCHVNRVKRLATSPIEPSLFWSAAEDGLIIQYDLREQHECSSSQRKVLIDLSSNYGELKCVAINPMKPHYLAVGANDCYVRLYDRRMLKPYIREGHFLLPMDMIADKSSEREPVELNCAQYYAPGHLAVENAKMINYKLAVTNISFNSAGSEMLANMGGEHIYLFNVNNSRHISDMQVPQIVNKKDQPVCKHCRKTGGNGYINGVRLDQCSEENCMCFYLERANQCQKRKWMGDVYNAARDFLYVIQNWPNHTQAYIGLIECLIELKWGKEAQRWLDYFLNLPINSNHEKSVILPSEVQNVLVSNQEKADRENELADQSITERTFKKVGAVEQKRRLESLDFELRFLGHCNTTTDIKEASFLGEDGNYVCAGSDEGIIFVWERKKSKIVTALFGDVSIVNCVQPHPSACFIASSGIDSGVKLWSPLPELEDFVNPRKVTDIKAVVEANQNRMALDPLESMLVNMGYRLPGLHNEVPVCQTC
ncbi:WD and tetratricopeptide repeats protein 1-like [Diabrotica undecimpunctata]|uniref:WD and tetratricopeptide repeats protein 1-like n=1 Tax=Diabrotica undecimpunctata TaxID=50387 RepID=UPI003B638EC1